MAAPIRSALFPGLASVADDRQRMHKLFYDSAAFMTMLALPFGVGLGLVAEEAVPLILGEQWRGAVPVLQALAPLLAVLSVWGVNSSILLALGKTRVLFRIDLIQLLVKAVTAVALIAIFDLYGALGSRVISAAVWLIQVTIITSALLGDSVLELFRRTWRSLASVIAMIVVVSYVDLVLEQGSASESLILLAKIAGGCMAYIGTHLCLWAAANRPHGPEDSLLRAGKLAFGNLRSRH
jgi:PST family polysaccharide transporter